MNYISQNLNIKIYIAKTDIDATDKVKLYETTTDPSNPTLLATLIATETTDDPSQTGDAYLFQFKKRVSQSDTYSFYYTVIDKYGNESASVSSFSEVVCLTPQTPSALTLSELDFGSVGGVSIGNVDLTTNLFAHYKLNETTPTDVVIDSSGNNRHGSTDALISDITSTGILNGCYNIDERHYNVPVFDSSFSFTGVGDLPFSFSLWIYGSTYSTTQYLVTKQDSGSYTFESEYRLVIDSGALYFSLYSEGAATNFIGRSTGNAVSINNWHNVTVTYSGSKTSAGVKIYVDGERADLSNYESLPYEGMSSTLCKMLVGALQNSAEVNNVYDSYIFKGKIDNVIFWDKELNTDEVSYLYNNGTGTEDLDTSYYDNLYTIYHYPISNPSQITTDGDYPVTDTTFPVITPSDDDYYYYRTQKNAACNVESAASSNLKVTVANSEAVEYPTADPTNLYCNPSVGGTFQIVWTYPNYDSTDIFNVYYSTDDPSSDNWTLDGDIDYHAVHTRYYYTTTTAWADSTTVWFKVVPATVYGSNIYEKYNDLTTSCVADAQAPTVTIDHIDITLE